MQSTIRALIAAMNFWPEASELVKAIFHGCPAFAQRQWAASD